MRKKLEEVLDFTHFTEKLKTELRHSWTSTGRQESVADHSWRLCVLLIVCAPHIEIEFDLLKAIKIALFHDIGESLIGDAHYLDITENKITMDKRFELESKAVKTISNMLKTENTRIYDLWVEFEGRDSIEGQIVSFLDRLEVCIQHIEADISTWTEQEITSIREYFDKLKVSSDFLMKLKDYVKREALQKVEFYI